MNTILNRYDNEYIGLINEICNRLIYFTSEANLKIRSWIQLLSIPHETKEEKQNRNLYAIKLLNQMINGKIKYPFNNYANINELKPILAIDIRAELTKKFYMEINLKNIVNFGYQMQNKFLSSHPEYFKEIKNDNTLRNSNNSFENNTINLNDMKTVKRTDNKEMKNIEKEIDDYVSDYNSDINEEENEKLYKIIKELEKKINEGNKKIEYQNNEINKLINILDNLNNRLNNNKE